MTQAPLPGNADQRLSLVSIHISFRRSRLLASRSSSDPLLGPPCHAAAPVFQINSRPKRAVAGGSIHQVGTVVGGSQRVSLSCRTDETENQLMALDASKSCCAAEDRHEKCSSCDS
ncbi:Hexose transporter HXT15 [Fusarium oxysporum f. sp. albedinis]|nr:Hexose transporter HXT15 [Fusarium oxysporum f. sp. albedinis]